MLVLISVALSTGVLAILYKVSRQRTSSLQRKYQTLILLRQVLLLSRQHRAITHYALSGTHEPEPNELNAIYHLMVEKSNELIALSPFENKPMYRIMLLKLKGLHTEWRQRSIARSQVIHGQTIRHCLFLMDEVAIAWLIDSGREDLSDNYHTHWQQVLDCMETLTQLRVSIQDSHYPEGMLMVKYYCDKTRRKLNQLSLICPMSIASPLCSGAMLTLTEINSCKELELTLGQLYQLTTDISLIIAQVYDQILSDVTESLYLPLPQVTANQI
ncbi:hypothetical protein [Vibrio ostreicida]|uniref:hypothetical protein n=1 Tax=Vibrio ostreicida TaxID=526588 RepID=UPI000970E66B|nr:hypothetical protein [Vibrio ostreicida]